GRGAGGRVRAGAAPAAVGRDAAPRRPPTPRRRARRRGGSRRRFRILPRVTAVAATPIADPLEHGARLRAGRLALAAGFVVFALKLGAWWLTGSTAVLSDALESIVNVAAAGLLLYSLYVSSRPADRDHPYGHGKVEFFSAGVEGTLIGVAALLIAAEAVRQLVRGPELRSIDVGLALVTLATGANA